MRNGMKKPSHYSCASCSFECPNSIFTDGDYDTATELGYKRVRCEECYLNDGKCNTCLFEGNTEGICDGCDRRSEV